MNMRKHQGCPRPFAVLVLAMTLCWTAADATIPAPEHTFYGTVSVDGSPLFAGTVSVTRSPGSVADCPADCDSGTCSLTVFSEFEVPPNPPVDYVYVLRVPIDTVPPLVPGVAAEGEAACFYINGQLSGSTIVGERGETTRFDVDPIAQPGLSIDDVAVFEGTVGTTPMIFTVTVEPPAVTEILVEYRTEDGTATTGDVDYNAESETLTLNASPAAPLSSFNISVGVLADVAQELDETFIVRLIDVENARIVDAEGLGTIRDDDAPARVKVAATTVTEGDVDAVFNVWLSRALGARVEVSYATQMGTGTATPGLDYLAATGMVTILAGGRVGTFSVPILADSRHEPNETFFVELSDPVNAILDPPGSIAEGTITDDERMLDWIEAERDGVAGVEGLDTAIAAVVTADGRNVYTAGQFDNAISIFDRAPDDAADAGELNFVGFIADETGTGFIEILGVAALAMSHDDRYLFAASSTSSTVTVFDRSQLTGMLTIADVAKEGVDGVTGVAGASAMALSPDGGPSHLYVASPSSKTLAVFDRDELSGALTHVQTLTEGLLGVDGLAGVVGLDVTPDGAHVYTASYLENGVARFDRDAITGELSFVEALRAGESDALGRLVDGTRGAQGVAISPDGRHVYVTGRSDHSLAAFRRAHDAAGPDYGQLTYLESETQAVGGVDGLDGASSVTVSLDGKFVYVTGFQADAVAVFARDTNPASSEYGELDFIETRRNSESDVSGVGRPTWAAVGPGDREVYVTGSLDDAVAVFFRELEIPSNPHPLSFEFSHVAGVWSNDATVDVSWSGAADDDGGSGVGGYSFQFISTPPGGVSDEFVDARHGDDPQRVTSPPLADGSYDFHVRTCDRGANCASDFVVPGPFLIDVTPPAGPEIIGNSLISDVATLTWNPSPDGTGSGLSGYMGCFDTSAGTDCAACQSAQVFDVATGGPNLPAGATSATSPSLFNAAWYFHICPADDLGNVGATVHVPVLVDLCRDADLDGFGSQPNTTCPNAGTDCDDDNPAINVGTAFYRDLDGDGFGDAAITKTECAPGPGFVTDNTDCNDADADVRPGALEDCDNGIDDNCNGDLDDPDASCLSGCGGSVRDLRGAWSFIGARVVDVGLNASGLCGKMLDVGAPSSPEVHSFVGGAWEGHHCGVPVNDFNIDVSRSYFVRSELPTRWCEEGTPVFSPLAVSLAGTWNPISIPDWADGAYTAASACQEINAQGGTAVEIDRYVNGAWQGHVCGFPFDDFPLVPGEGYFVRSISASTWLVPEPPSSPDMTAPAATVAPTAPAASFGAPSSPPEELCVRQPANVTGQSFTIVWAADRPTTGSILYGTSPDHLTKPACDVRDGSYPDCSDISATHFIQVDGLMPETTYYVQGFTDGRPIGKPFEVTTGPMLAVPPSDTIYGSVVEAGSPAADTYVCATVEDGDGFGDPGSSATVCGLVSVEDVGYWSMNLGGLRTADHQAVFGYSELGDQVRQRICGAGLGCAERDIDTGADAPAVTAEITEACEPAGVIRPDPSEMNERLKRLEPEDAPDPRQDSRGVD